MKILNHFIHIATLAISIVSCQKEPSFHHDAIPSPSDLVASLVPETYGIDGDNTFVPAMAVEGYAMSKKPAITKAGGSISVEPVLNEANDTVFYIVNYGENDGWELISADARTPRILAEGYSGSFTYPTEIEPLNVWIEGMIADLTAVREAEDSELTFSSEQISANISAWTGVAAPHVIQPGELDGNYWGTSTYEEQPYDSIPHMMVTQWHQEAPYNSYVPWKFNRTERGYAGCVAVAAAQVMYYLHYYLSIPIAMESYASCESVIGIGNWLAGMYQSVPSYTVWNQMVPTYRTGDVGYCPEAVMIARFGTLLSSQYSDGGTGAEVSDLKSDVFRTYGIDCESRSYTTARVKAGLLTRTPVIVGADLAGTIFGHAFVIDGYKRVRNKVTTHFTWVPSDPHSFDDPANHPDFETISYTDPEIQSVRMNWGDSDQWTNGEGEGWYRLTSSWYYTGGALSLTDIVYNFERR